MSSHTVSLKCLNHATLERMNCCIRKELQMNHILEKRVDAPFLQCFGEWLRMGLAFGYELDKDSTPFQQPFIVFHFLLYLFVFFRFTPKSYIKTYRGKISVTNRIQREF
jgi:hypothetical protein